MTALAEAPAFTAGVYDGMSEETYHGDPVPGGSLSASGARKLLPPSCPARFRYEQDHPRPSTAAQEKGTAAHELVLGTGRGIVLVDADNWRTNAAKAAAEEARAEGKVPLLAADYEQVQGMAAALRAHPVASALLNPERGKPEQSLFWQDPATGVWRRCRYDWLPDAGARDRLIVPDYKTTAAADLPSIEKWIARFGYFQQAAWYIDAARALGLHPDPAFVFVFQEKEPPYLITTVQLDADSLRVGRDLNREAISLYAACTERGEWPGYTEGIEVVSLPAWARRQYEEVAW